MPTALLHIKSCTEFSLNAFFVSLSSKMSATQSWPKDRVLYHRLEQLVYCVEHNEWPSAAAIKSMRGVGGDCASDFGDSPSQRSSPSSTPKHAVGAASSTTGNAEFADGFGDERISPKVTDQVKCRILRGVVTKEKFKKKKKERE